ncbi:pyrimidine d [Actinidia rufa]|uniref:Pyrimidine d n=1 Tax=Actinidia rufa TaxID=165716 RepID=A0A7J0DPM6_9ERIC|nr:pyrimidine d [Actinidia rufa]
MSARFTLKFMRECFHRKLRSSGALGLGASRHYSTSSHAPQASPKVPHSSKKGRLLTGATLGLVIAGGAYASTVDEATFWYFI